MTVHSDDDLRRLFDATRVIAVVGVSANPLRPSYFVARYLALRGFRVIPVNPGLAGQALFGERAVASLADIPADTPVDMVDIFRRSDQVLPVAVEALAHLPALRTIWMQLGVVNEAAADLARARGVTVVMDRCPKIEVQRLYGELRRAGLNTGIVSSRL